MGTPSILEAIEQSTQNVVEAGGVQWKVRKICSADLARVGHAALAVAQGMSKNEPSELTEEKAQEAISAASVKQLETMAKLKDAVIAAGLIAVGDEKGESWTDVTIVLDAKASDAKNGRLWVGALPPDVSEPLFTEIMSLSTDGGAALDRLQSFRARSRNAARRGSNSKKVRKATP
ncbi:MAG: hypothetical protein Unbinned4944contig1000_17 [Prokaryotic dsDNA virus sp.]|nr:MAG: hypothetical protein Unbinned4944contig1000_17 [Prokaryotic dsDNA virus sp.]|tara:strand:+ start:854 stop:1381 length:528 start_codon:yes stop_codon:yes gene_type:complete